MNRTEYMQKVYATSLDQVSKSILIYLGFCKNWKRDTLAFPSHARIARDTGLSARTVKRKVPELRRLGYLSDTGIRKGRGVIAYNLTDPTSVREAPQVCHSGTMESHRGAADVPDRHTEPVREPVHELVTEQVHTAPVVADAPTVTVEDASSLPKEGCLPSWGYVWVSETGDLLFETDTGSGVYMLGESGVSALSLPETRTAAPVDPDPIPTDAPTPVPFDADMEEHRRRWARFRREHGRLTVLDYQRMQNESNAIHERHGVEVPAW